MSSAAGTPHVASALSCADILVSLYFHIARVSPERVTAADRDRIILSKGHASAALFACLAERGFFALSWLASYCQDGAPLAEHPSRGGVPGVEVSTGSLGHGLGVGAGLALGARLDGSPSRVFVLMSDGECNEGSVWEAALWAPRHGLGNLVAIIDFNKLQATGSSVEITELAPLVDKWRAFGWDAVEVDGHDFGQLVPALERQGAGRPQVVVAHTVKGKGVSFMEGNLEWHYRPPSQDDLRRALDEVANSR
jgi:transketolase